MTLKGHDHDANTPIILTRVEDRLRLWLALNGVMGATSGVETGPLSADDFAVFPGQGERCPCIHCLNASIRRPVSGDSDTWAVVNCDSWWSRATDQLCTQ